MPQLVVSPFSFLKNKPIHVEVKQVKHVCYSCCMALVNAYRVSEPHKQPHWHKSRALPSYAIMKRLQPLVLNDCENARMTPNTE